MTIVKRNSGGCILRRYAVLAASAVTIVLLIVAAGFCQSYYEASGQSAVFTLAAGAKSGPAAVRDQRLNRPMESGIGIVPAKGGLLVTVPLSQRGRTDVAVYTMAGRQMYRRHGLFESGLRIDTRQFGAGIYTVCVHAGGLNFSRRFAIDR
jgi:hypothetical protein